MTDEDVVLKFFAVVGKRGSVYGPYVRNGKSGARRKPIFRWICWNQEEVQEIHRLFEPYLGNRRKARFAELFKESGLVALA